MKKLMLFILVLLFSFSLPAFALPTALTLQSVTETAVAANLQSCDSANGNKFLNTNEDVLLLAQNTDGTNSATVSVTAQVTSIEDLRYGTISKASQSVSLAAGAIKIMGPFPASIFNDSSGYVSMTISGTGASSVKFLPFKSGKLIKVR
jgi:hypothetical protein